MHQLALELQCCNGLGRLAEAHLQGQGQGQLSRREVQGNMLPSCLLQASS